jgi:hypothetical protein
VLPGLAGESAHSECRERSGDVLGEQVEIEVCRVLGIEGSNPNRCRPLRYLLSAHFAPLSLHFLQASACQDGSSVEAARLEILERLLRVRKGVFVGGHP